MLRKLFSEEVDTSLEVGDAVLKVRRVRHGYGDEVLQETSRGGSDMRQVRREMGENTYFVVGPESDTASLHLVDSGTHHLLHDSCIFTARSKEPRAHCIILFQGCY